ncbi:acetylxylan esterase [Lactococcus hodotermopsidis]|uniref:Acetylxylan esterase n=1 Tax=Pseudolactococcus hodotermopsidis TaxID=2709157 RepID=A0A6A0BHN3_9LACT|nr:acetylxylan esterase [Lactococcus hodotermopsidis]GFH43307.1 acetylxylan esterase [Lactococcus hodotermopsidis]
MIDLSKLEDYKGTGNKPADFDDYWDKALAELADFPLNYELTEIAFKSNVARAYHLWFTAPDGARIHAQFLTPKETTGKKFKGLLQFHGYHGDSGDWVDKIGAVAEGFVVAALDARGQGGLSEDNTVTAGGVMKGLIIRGMEEGADNLYYKRVFLDCAHLAKILMSLDFVDETRVFAQGASQGGALTIACAALVPEIKKVIATYPFLCDYRKAYNLGAQTSAFEEIPYWFQFRDPLHKQENEIFETLSYIDLQHLAPRIKAEVAWVMGLQDEVVPPETQLSAYLNITSKKQLIPVYEYGHEYLPKVSDNLQGFFE